MNTLSENRANNFLKYNWLCNPILANWIVDMLNVYGNSILDIGCGNGYMLDFYSKTFDEIAAIEPSDSFVNKIKENIAEKNIIFKQASAEQIPFQTNSFDIVFAKSSLHHFINMQQGLLEMQRVSKNVIAIMEVISPSKECLPFLQNLLVKKEEGRSKTSIFTRASLNDTISNAIQVKQINQIFYDQYIDIETWLQYSDLSNAEKEFLLSQILSMDTSIAKHMQLHKRNNRYVMLRRMCLCIVFI